MAKKKRVGVTGPDRAWSPAWWCSAFALRLVGASPKRISVSHNVDRDEIDALVIGGGDDIGADHYGGDITAMVKSDPERDQLEIDWIRWALDNDVPLLGICRGAQLVNVVLGGTLYQDISTLRKRTYNRSGLLPTKQVQLDTGSNFSKICNTERLRVNSLHHQAIKDPGSGVRIVGWDLDRFPQAIESDTEQKLIGVQWHPEYLLYLPRHLALFRWLLDQLRP